MNLEKLTHGHIRKMEVRQPEAPFAAGLAPGTEGVIRRLATDGTILDLGGKVWVIEGAGPADAQCLADLTNQNLPRLLWLTAATPPRGAPTRLFLQIHQFPLALHWPAQMDLGVPEPILDKVRRDFGSQRWSARQVVDWLNDNLLLPAATPGAPRRGFLSAGGERVADDTRAFRLHGVTVNADLERAEDGRLLVARLSRPLKGRKGPPILLLEAPLSFCDAGTAAVFAGEAQSQLDRIVAGHDSYLEIWREYKELAWQVTIEEAIEFGSFPYDSWSWGKDKEGAYIEFHLRDSTAELEQQLRALQGAREISLEAGTELPDELRRRTDEDAPPPARPAEPPLGRKRAPRGLLPFSGRCDRKGVLVERGVIQLRPTTPGHAGPKPPPQGLLYPSLAGDKASRKRRDAAFEKVRSASGPMPQLGLLVEGQFDLLPVAQWPGIDPMALRVAGELTLVQKEALHLALNTPDIVLIQGPPGTGKTTVIAALMRCLGALANRSTGLRGLMLLSSFQHDAVENAAAKGLVNGLPVMKIGGRRRGGATATGIDKNARDWAEERIKRLKPRLKETPAQAAYQQVQQRVRSYVLAPGTPRQTVGILREVLDLVKAPDRASADLIPLALRERLVRCIETLERDGDAEGAPEPLARARRAVRALRCEPISFADDGPARALKSLVRLKAANVQDSLNDEARDLLARAAESSEPAPPFLPALAALRERLLAALTPESLPRTADLPQLKIQQLLNEVLSSLHERSRESAQGPAAILAEYLHDLENDPPAVHQALVHYTPVLASTCQQAASNQMADVKGRELVYDTVIIDEAARANPLDLFIPMVMARRRIILVGDHRQLPHSLEQKLQKQIDESGSVETRDILATSLFERLFTSLEQRKRAGDLPRTITLNTQFRMHHILGDFVSAQFYERRDGTKVETGVPDEKRSHTLKGYMDTRTGVGKVAAWIDVPLAKYGPEDPGMSKSRPAEARRIAREVKALVDQTDEFTFGVITFYSAQVGELLRELRKTLGAERLRELQAHGRGKTERLCVGTVDAFQGKEFDVVFLSMTRSNALPHGDGATLRRKYGHLMLENRLCVAMSRQKRLLVTVGDTGMLQTAAAPTAIGPLVAFHKLCEEHGLLLR